ncbi:MAG: PQQ-binding-like beta-propeller repeat protein [Phycisphaerae bacterium]
MSLTRFATAWIFGLVVAALLGNTALAGPTTTSAPAYDWPQFRGPNRDGKSAETGLLAKWPEGGPKLLWSLDNVGAGFSHVTVANGLVYVTGLVGKDGVLRALTLDGKPVWEAKYGPEHEKQHTGARTVPNVRDGRVYIVSAYGLVSCFDAAKGDKLWSVDVFEKYQAKQVMWGFAECLLIEGDSVIVTPCGQKATMVALDRGTGNEVWASEPLGQESGYCQPVAFEHAGKRMIVTLTKKAIVAFSPADGKVLWQHPYANFRGNHCDAPIYSDGLLYVASGYGKGAIALELGADGKPVKQLWEQPRQDPVHGQSVLIDGYVYASSHQSAGGKWSCVELKTGKLMWLDACVGKGGSVIYADGMLYCYSEDGVVGLVRPSPEKCQVVSTFKVTRGEGSHWAHPVVSHGRLFIRHGNALMCYDVSSASGQ